MSLQLYYLYYVKLKVIREDNFHQGPLNALSISNKRSILFLAAQNGVILAVALPMMYQVIRKEFKMHNNGITKVIIFK